MIILHSFLSLLEVVTFIKSKPTEPILIVTQPQRKKAQAQMVKLLQNPGIVVQKMRLLPDYIE